MLGHTGRQTDIQVDRQADIQVDRQTDIQVDRQADIQVVRHVYSTGMTDHSLVAIKYFVTRLLQYLKIVHLDGIIS